MFCLCVCLLACVSVLAYVFLCVSVLAYVFLWTKHSERSSQISGEVQTKAGAREGESPCLISCYELSQGCDVEDDDQGDADDNKCSHAHAQM